MTWDRSTNTWAKQKNVKCHNCSNAAPLLHCDEFQRWNSTFHQIVTSKPEFSWKLFLLLTRYRWWDSWKIGLKAKKLYLTRFGLLLFPSPWPPPPPGNVSIRNALLALASYTQTWACLSTHHVMSLYQHIVANKSRVNVMCMCMPLLACVWVSVCVCVLRVIQRQTLANEDFLHLPHSLLIPDKVFNLLAWPGPPSDPMWPLPSRMVAGLLLPRQPQHDKNQHSNKSPTKCELMLQTDFYQTRVEDILYL